MESELSCRPDKKELHHWWGRVMLNTAPNLQCYSTCKPLKYVKVGM